MKLQKPLVILLALTQLFCSCVAYRDNIDATPEAIHEQIEVGDAVEVLTVNNKVYTFKVSEVNEDQIIGIMGVRQYKIPYSRIKGIKKGHVDAGSTVVLVVGSIILISIGPG